MKEARAGEKVYRSFEEYRKAFPRPSKKDLGKVTDARSFGVKLARRSIEKIERAVEK